MRFAFWNKNEIYASFVSNERRDPNVYELTFNYKCEQ